VTNCEDVRGCVSICDFFSYLSFIYYLFYHHIPLSIKYLVIKRVTWEKRSICLANSDRTDH